jgi:hypothetical protein
MQLKEVYLGYIDNREKKFPDPETPYVCVSIQSLQNFTINEV